MERIRKGNDIEIQWSIYASDGMNEAPYDLSGKNVSLYLKSQFGTTQVSEFAVKDNVVSFTFYGKDQKHTGAYSLLLVENDGMLGMHTVDECDAFSLVSHSCNTGGEAEGRVECISLQFSTNVGVFITTPAPAIEVDSELSLESENPVQNKVITDALTGVSASMEIQGEQISSLGRALATKADKADIPTKTSQLSNDSGFLTQHQDISNLATKDDVLTKADKSYVDQQNSTKQDTISDLEAIRHGASLGTTAIQEVKTINGQSLLGEGNIEIQGGGGGAFIPLSQDFSNDFNEDFSI